MLDKEKLVILGIIVSASIGPSMILTWQSGWIEIFDSYLFFVFGVYSLLTNRFYPLGISSEQVFEPLAFISISVSWLLLSFILAAAYRFLRTTTSSILLASILLCFSLQIVVPLLLLSLVVNPGILITIYIPLPLPSLIALIGYIDSH